MAEANKSFQAGVIYCLGQMAERFDSVFTLKALLDELDFLPDAVTREALVEAGGDVYDAERVMACLERRPVQEVD